MRKHIYQACEALKRVYIAGEQLEGVVMSSSLSPMAVKLVYGVLENDVKAEYIISRLVQARPRGMTLILLKVGVYALISLDEVPKFAIVSECVEVAKRLGKGNQSGFVNAVLKRVADGKYSLPKPADKDYLSVNFSKPQWFVDALTNEFGTDVARDILAQPVVTDEHIRVNARLSSLEEVENALRADGEDFAGSEVGGLCVRVSPTVRRLFNEGAVTYQAASSMLAVRAMAVQNGKSVLDVCAAPGGKAIYISELCPDSKVLALDVNSHRASLMSNYVKRMRAVNVETGVADALKPDGRYFLHGGYDYVLADVPCSCMGMFRRHPDTFLKKRQDPAELYTLQSGILRSAAQAVKPGGVLVYSTCTLFRAENGDIVDGLLMGGKFQKEHIEGFETIDGGRYADNDGAITVIPYGIYDGFYIARLRRMA